VSVLRLGVVSSGGLVDNRVEAVVLVGGVVDSSDGAVRFNKTILSLDYISVASLVLGLDVSGVVVVYSVFESVLRGSLKK